MASFLTSPQLPTSEYIPAVDPSAYATAIGQKQALYNQGVAKIQASVDTVAGVQVVKDAHKAYLNTAVQGMQSDINRLAGEDFSKQSVVNQALGLSSKVARDPVIQNAQMSTQAYQRALQQRESYIKEGKTSVENDTFFNKRVNSWLNDGDVSSSFNAEYIPYVDIQSEFLNIYKSLKPDSTLTQEQFSIDGGNIVLMKEISSEAIDTSKINQAWDLLKQRGDIKTQLAINADYQYGSLDKTALTSIATQSYVDSLKDNSEKIQDLRARLATDKTANAVEVNQEIEQLEEQGEILAGNISYIENMDESGLRTSIYEQQLGNSFASTFRYKKESEKVMSSPYQDARYKQLDYELKLQQFEEQKRKNARGGGEAAGISTQVMKRPVSEEQGKLGESTFMKGLESTKAELQDQTRKHIVAISQAMGLIEPWRLSPEGEYIPNVGPGAYASAAEAQHANDYIYGYSKVLYDTGKSKPMVNTMFDEVSGLVDQVQAMETTSSQIREQFNVIPLLTQAQQSTGPLPNLISTINNGNVFSTTDQRGKAITLDINDLTDLVLQEKYKSGSSNAEIGAQARERLLAKFPQWEEPGLSTLALGIATDPKSSATYKELRKAIDNSPELVKGLQNMQQAFKDAQRTFISYQEDFVPSKPEEYRDISGRYRAVLGQLTSADRGENYNTFIKALDDEKNQPQLGYYYNRLDNQVYLTARIPGKEDVIEVPVAPSDAANIPGVQIANDFERKYGARLALGKGTTTDPSRQGINPFPVGGPPNRNYTVKYHLFGPGDGTYMMKLYVWDKNGKKLMDGAPYAPSTVQGYMSQDQILSAVQQFQNDKFVEGILTTNQ